MHPMPQSRFLCIPFTSRGARFRMVAIILWWNGMGGSAQVSLLNASLSMTQSSSPRVGMVSMRINVMNVKNLTNLMNMNDL